MDPRHPGSQEGRWGEEFICLMSVSAGWASLLWLAMWDKAIEVAKSILSIPVSHVMGKQRTLLGL